jgi:hypothetical protein
MDAREIPELTASPKWRRHGVLVACVVVFYAWQLFENEYGGGGGWIRLDFGSIIAGVGVAHVTLSSLLVLWFRISSWFGLLMAQLVSFLVAVGGLLLFASFSGR